MKLCEKYKWIPVAYADKPVEECAPAFLGFIEVMNDVIEAVRVREAKLKEQKPAS